jgi:hypothetical protein
VKIKEGLPVSDMIKQIKELCALQEKNQISEQWALHQIGKVMKHDDVIKSEIEQLRHDSSLVEHPISKRALDIQIEKREQMLDETNAFAIKIKHDGHTPI